MIKSKLKSGFTLIELMVFFIFISILLAASTPIITKRVKNLPLKVYHGKYMCYRNEDGALVEEYYNASIRVKDPTVVDACHFNPPKKATVYKIEMIGGGAGGYRYFDRKSELEEREGVYHIGSGMSYTDSKFHEVPTGAQLKKIFRGAQFRYVSANVGQGGNGSTVRVSYAPFENGHEYQFIEGYEDLAKCTSEQKNELTPDQQADCTVLKQKEKDADAKIAEMIAALAKDGNNYYIYAGNNNVQAINDILSPYKKLHTSKATVFIDKYGALGGSGGYLTYKGLIDFMDYSKSPAVPISIDGVDSYLKSLPNHMTSGSLRGPAVGAACPGWTSSSPENGANGSQKELTGYDNELISVKGDKGGNVDRYGALKVWERCVSNKIRATGGEGAYAELNGTFEPQHIRYNDRVLGNLTKGEDADGVVGDKSTGLGSGHRFSFSSSSEGSAWPSLIINTYLHKITHTVGKNGTSGQVKTVFESNLRGDCKFTIGKNGRVITDQDTNVTIADEESKLATTLSCNGDTIIHTVEGGRYQQSTVSDSKSEFEYMNNPPNYTFETVPPTADSASQYNPTNVFTKYNIGPHNFGQGGAGSGIVDNCMHPQGYYQHMLKTIEDSISHTEQYGLDEPFTCEMNNPAHFRTIDPTEGVGGAIIISW